MCGLLAIATVVGGRVGVDDVVVARMRDRMVHRGPDGAGLWRGGHVVLAHRRLSVIDPTEAGAQPMRRGRFTLVYNGELYNDRELRGALGGWRFRSACDTETVLAALATWGSAGLERLRGMYALALHDAERETLLLARDPLGVKPLFVWRGVLQGDETVVAASEIPAIVAHPGIEAAPDMEGVSAYLTTIRTSVGERTMFKGVSCVRPGEAMELSLGGEAIRTRKWAHWPAGRREERDVDDAQVGAVVSESVRAHLRADVPMCSLLSGGLDSSIIASVVATRVAGLRTYCSGAIAAGEEGDFEHARLMAATLGVTHVEVPVTGEIFGERWGSMIERMGLPLSTPNEVAINEVARVLRREGNVVALSGEGADELFGGYGPVMEAAAAHVEAGDVEPAMFQLGLASWVPVGGKGAVLNGDVWKGVEEDAGLVAAWREEFERARADGPGDGLQAHLRHQRRVNLAGLLGRLDSATMLEGVEGRTPFADRVVAEMAERLPMERKFEASVEGGTKRALRSAFAGVLPREVVGRAKASFPLPFQAWVVDRVEVLRESGFALRVFSPAAIETVAREPERLWNLAWPMVNVARWGEVWGW